MAFALLSGPRRMAAVAPMSSRRRRSTLGSRARDSQPGFDSLAFPLRATSRPVAPFVQTKLKIGEPNDRFEEEADRVADEVMRMPEPRPLERTAVSGSVSPYRIQRICQQCEEESSRRPVMIQRRCAECEEELQRWPQEGGGDRRIQAESIPGRRPEVTASVQAQISGLRGSGQPLPDSLRAFFEPRFGYDFSQVMVHTAARAASLAEAVNARAFTLGNDIVFGRGAFAPQSSLGQRLLAHELAHVVQQAASQRSRTEAVTQKIQRAPAAEDEATCEVAEFPPAAVWFSDPVLARIRADEQLMAFGSVGEPVELVQRTLVAWGCDEGLGHLLPKFGADGTFGGETRAAVKTFQGRQGLEDDGIVGPLTMAELDRFIPDSLIGTAIVKIEAPEQVAPGEQVTLTAHQVNEALAEPPVLWNLLEGPQGTKLEDSKLPVTLLSVPLLDDEQSNAAKAGSGTADKIVLSAENAKTQRPVLADVFVAQKAKKVCCECPAAKGTGLPALVFCCPGADNLFVKQAFQRAATLLNNADGKMQAPNAETTHANILTKHFSGTQSKAGKVSTELKKVMKTVRSGFKKDICPDCRSTPSPGISADEAKKMLAGAPKIFKGTNCYEFYPGFFKLKSKNLPAKIAIHEMVHRWSGKGDIEYEGDKDYPPALPTSLQNADSYASAIRDLGVLP